MCFFKKIIRTEIIGTMSGISEEDKLNNLAVGHMMGGFHGVMHARLLNESEGEKTTFLVIYSDNTSSTITVNNNSLAYKKYIAYLNND